MEGLEKDLSNFLSFCYSKRQESIIDLAESEVNELDKDEIAFRLLKYEDKKLDIDLKKQYGNTVLGVLVAWVAFVILVVAAQLGPVFNHLSDNVLITLITTSTANIIVLPYIVLRYLFKKDDK